MLDLVADHEIRAAAFALVRRLQDENGGLSRQDLFNGVQWRGRRIRLDGPVQGIWKPKGMDGLLSIKTAWPRQRPGRPDTYPDQRQALREHFESRDVLEYSFMKDDPNHPHNRQLRDAWQRRIPIIYLIASYPGFYQAFFPAFIVGWDPAVLRARVAFGFETPPETENERRIGIAIARRQYDHAAFRENVLSAYRETCAVSGVMGRSHVGVAELAPSYGPAAETAPAASAGVALSKLHRAAFASDLLGIDADGRIHVAQRAAQYRGKTTSRQQPKTPVLDALLASDGAVIQLPEHPDHRPDRSLLDLRYQQFLRAN